MLGDPAVVELVVVVVVENTDGGSGGGGLFFILSILPLTALGTSSILTGSKTSVVGLMTGGP